MRTEAEKTEHMCNASDAISQLCKEAEARKMPVSEVFESFAMILAARNPTLCGKIVETMTMVVTSKPLPIVASDGKEIRTQ